MNSSIYPTGILIRIFLEDGELYLIPKDVSRPHIRLLNIISSFINMSHWTSLKRFDGMQVNKLQMLEIIPMPLPYLKRIWYLNLMMQNCLKWFAMATVCKRFYFISKTWPKLLTTGKRSTRSYPCNRRRTRGPQKVLTRKPQHKNAWWFCWKSSEPWCIRPAHWVLW